MSLSPKFKVTPTLIEQIVASEYYLVIPGTTMTICAIRLTNGFVVTGESACVMAANFDAELGRKLARKMAMDKVANLAAFSVCDIIAEQEQAKL